MNPTSSECFGTLQTACLSVACGGSSARPSAGLLDSLPQRLPSTGHSNHPICAQRFPDMGVSPKNRGIFTPKMDGEHHAKPFLKWMIWGYHYFWKHPYRKQICLAFMNLFHYGMKSIY